MILHPRLFGSADAAVKELGRSLKDLGHELHAPRWQGIKSPAPMLEVMGLSFRCPIRRDQTEWEKDIKPNMPWAEAHFLERVSGTPSNPGETYKFWPFYPKDERDQQVRPNQKFTHTYQERIWPKFAGDFDDRPWQPIRGIRYDYGDLNNVVNLLNRDRLTRQAYLPIWFPEDTGAAHEGRVPCSLGYLFMIRHEYMHCTYYIRSCDYFRHLRDDIYLAGRLTQWIVNEMFEPPVNGTGLLDMHMGSLHCWLSEKNILPK